jgi:predicted dehydrogenase
MLAWSIVGHRIPDDHWYYSAQAGGRVLGNLVHWTDVSLRLLALPQPFPIEITPMVPRDSRANFVVSMKFSDDSLGCITFSVKEEPYDGVREQLFLHKGNLVLRMTDFQRTEYDVGARRERFRTLFRQPGHRENISNSLASLRGGSEPAGVEETWVSGVLLLAAKHAVDRGIRVRVDADGNITELEQVG